MTIENFVQAMPKVEVNLQFEGSIEPETLIVIAEQNDVPLLTKRFKTLVKQFEEPDFAHLDAFIREVSKWIQQPEDFTRIVYEIGVSQAKQNVKYTEVGFNPSLYAENGLTFEQVLTALNDGRERVQRAWNVEMRWVLTGMRDEPRKMDDVIKWASSAAAIKGGVVGIGLTGQDVKGWVPEFERPFRTAQKKSLSRVIHAAESNAAVQTILEHLEPDRIIGGLAAVDDQAAIQALTDKHVAIGVCMAQSIAIGSFGSYADFPLRRLYDDGAAVSIGTGMPNFYRTTLVKEYLAAVQYAGLSVGEIEQVSLNAIQASFMPDEVKASMSKDFKTAYAALCDEHQVVLDSTFQ